MPLAPDTDSPIAKPRVIRDKAFAKRLQTACEANPLCPEVGRGQQKWIYDQLLALHGSATVHGFRTLASTVLNEHEFNRDWIELQLAHVDDDVRGIYNKAQWLSQRKDMLQWWADWLDGQRGQG